MDAGSKRITDKVWRGALPTGQPVKVRGSFGSGLACDGCDQVISPSQPEREVGCRTATSSGSTSPARGSGGY